MTTQRHHPRRTATMIAALVLVLATAILLRYPGRIPDRVRRAGL